MEAHLQCSFTSWIIKNFATVLVVLSILLHYTAADIDACINGTNFDNLFEKCSSDTRTSMRQKPFNSQTVCDSWDELVDCTKGSIDHCSVEAVVGEVEKDGKIVVGSMVFKKDVLYLLDGLQKSADYLCGSGQAKLKLLLDKTNFYCALDSYANYSGEADFKLPIDSSPENEEILFSDVDSSSSLFDQFEFDDISANGMDPEVCADLRYKKQRLANWLETGNCNYDDVILNMGEALEAFFNEVCASTSGCNNLSGTCGSFVFIVMTAAFLQILRSNLPLV